MVGNVILPTIDLHSKEVAEFGRLCHDKTNTF